MNLMRKINGSERHCIKQCNPGSETQISYALPFIFYSISAILFFLPYILYSSISLSLILQLSIFLFRTLKLFPPPSKRRHAKILEVDQIKEAMVFLLKFLEILTQFSLNSNSEFHCSVCTYTAWKLLN